LWFAGAARLTSSFSDEQRGLLDPGLRWIAEQGARISLSEYTQALEARAELIAKMNAFHQRYDVLLSPMLPLVAFEAGHNVPPGSGMAQWMEWTPFSYPFNLTQQPAASVPCGFTREGLAGGPAGGGGRFADEQVLRVCKVYEQHYPSRHLQAPVVG
jgi:aspartyl-tRNA(Asn)/glutamyl-tRNA(Gln) amidotransferase subunit A